MSKKVSKSHGGARKGSGRKPVDDPKVAVTIYVQKSVIDSIGGLDPLREQLYNHISKMK